MATNTIKTFEEAVYGDKIGTVTAVSIPSEFQFQLSPEKEKPLLQDFVVTTNPKDESIPLLAKIVRISRFNPLLPEESALELARMAADASFAPLPLFGKMEMMAVACQVLGSVDEKGKLRNPGFPVKPGNPVYLPSQEFMRQVLSGLDAIDDLEVGTLRNRADIKCTINGDAILNKHLAILAMTGSGKTYAASVFLEELIKKGYPLLIIDPHADYVNLGKKNKEQPFVYKAGSKSGKYRLEIFEKSIDITELDDDEFIDFIEGLSEEDISPSQRGIYKQAYKYAKEKGSGLKGIFEYLNQGDDEEQEAKSKKASDSEAKTKKNKFTIGAMFRQLGAARTLMSQVDTSLKLKEIQSCIGLGKGIVLNMSSQPSQIQRVNVQIILEKLFEKRKAAVIDGNKTFPPLFVVVEEAHNFAPLQVEDEKFPSRGILRRIATEGRKFGFGLCVISQRPSRLDATVLSQCNSQLILRIVNPNDQNYIRQTVESLAQTDLMALPDLSEGEALLSGAMVPLPSVVKIRQRESKEGVPAVNRLSEITDY